MGGKIINDVYEVDIQSKALISKSPLSIKKYAHSLCSTYGYIYSIGGFDSSQKLAHCEKYCVNDNKWEKLPNLLTPSNTSAVFACQSKCIYCYYGASNGGYINSIEKLRTGGLEWEYVNAKCIASPRECMHGIQLNDRQAIIFGGFNCGLEFNDCYIQAITDEYIECTQNANLMEGSSFYCSSAPIVVDGLVYAVDKFRRIHIYGNSKWEMIKI